MFEKTLEDKLKKIFKVKKVTYAQPGDSKEQECVFVTVENPRCTFKDGRSIARVTGTIMIQGNSDKMPFGYMAKAWAESSAADKKDLALFEIELNDKYYQNLVQRTASFVYFFSSQYDPNIGNIESINISIEVNP